MLGVPLYGHTWFVPGNSSHGRADDRRTAEWGAPPPPGSDSHSDSLFAFGRTAAVQGQCCGPFLNTVGAQPGAFSGGCGLMTYAEIEASGCPQHFDPVSNSTVMYCSENGADSNHTKAGTWVSFNDKQSVTLMAKYATATGLRGAFAYDASMDSIDPTGLFTYELMTTIGGAL
jgi:hypothetical protein